MKNIKKIVCLAVLFALMMVDTSWASGFTWETVPGHHNQSIILGPEYKSAEDIVQRYGRGEFLAEGSVKIENLKNGNIYITITTLAYKNVDRICHTVFLDQWNENSQKWVSVDNWEFEKTKEEANNDLHRLSTSFTLTGYEVNEVYRLRGLHLVELGDDIEGCATETDGVLITNN